ncbi:hypothetical protein H4R18_000585 [Coemansia javaensis]|uniref:Arrestin-like N-terminal domain-containing protein n=1 Tax=Coemansia javaensis TaxID=2761396 RepID=A0A9W8LLI6_9FUNG|nr:hypothetical protein H4R18_000585 [Coemansia javaensis]
MFAGSGQVSVSVHPRTTAVVLQRGAASSNILVGYVALEVRRATRVAALDVRFAGDQRLDMREGEGPSGTALSVRRRCAHVVHVLVDGSSSNGSLGAAAVESARVRSPGSAAAAARGAYAAAAAAAPAARRSRGPQQARRRGRAVELAPGEYRFPFELALPSGLASSVESPLGGVAYRLSAVLRRRRAGWLGSAAATESPAVAIDVYQAQCLGPRLRANPLLLGFPSLQALLATPLLLEATVAGGRWRLTVCSPSSRALVLGGALKLHLYATRVGAPDAPAPGGCLVLAEFDAALYELTTHAVPGSAVAPQTTRRRVAGTSLCLWSHRQQKQQHGACQSAATLRGPWALDPQTVDALGDAFDELPSVASLALALPRGGPRAVQASSAAPVFSVAHELVVRVRACEGLGADDPAACAMPACTMPARAAFASPVVVLPDGLAGADAAGLLPLPSYGAIAKDLVLASAADAAAFVSAAAAPPPPPLPRPPPYAMAVL